MQEADVQEALKAYVTDGEPAMGLTADGVLKAGRRSRRARRLAGVAGAGLAAVLAGVAAVGVWGGSPDGPEYMAADPCPVPPGARPAGVIAGDQPLSPNLVAWATTSVTCYLNAEVPRLLPTATYAQVPGAQAGPLMGFNLGGQPPWGNRVDALALIRDAKGVGDLTVNVGVVDESVAAQAEAECRGDTVAKCTVMSGPKGSTVLLGTEPDGTPAGEPKNWVVRVYRGHSEIYVQVSNTDRQEKDGAAPVATRPEPVLSADQAVQLALSPELYLFP
ncbi:hypothetical protein [Paractinoplanes durhamensis]|uniref:Uncharacterized protein n=1 Tax=Paractinoplanes durhamensis TaxID=113563 RepID=A0ABQ3Z419_9ACTN|nr:hypothetical protein [Actinoplanes durhamensis]GIE04588.1 hypothetical protein Adu01nite_59380 [Actinoplanes durhamensis]